MSKVISIELPDHVYQRLEERASQSADRSPESILKDSALFLFGDYTDLPQDIHELDERSSEELWALIERPVAYAEEQRLLSLIELADTSTLSADQDHELRQLLDLTDHVTLLRSYAAALLHQRGEDTAKRLGWGKLWSTSPKS